jgi:hypothetical protein
MNGSGKKKNKQREHEKERRQMLVKMNQIQLPNGYEKRRTEG